ncbi:unnamed protein product [Caenorhabditis sp. 36 PRJEB53466]|nr:unnamed protein product [Caenorhabditis sp. 36 PRJEB53466]
MSPFEGKTLKEVDNDTVTSQVPVEKPLGPTGKRVDYITWHQNHMCLARMLAGMSPKSEKRPTGCYIVDSDHYTVTSGYSGELPKSSEFCSDAVSVALKKLESKGQSAEGCLIYTTNFPECRKCAERIRASKIAKIWFWSDSETEDVEVKRLLGEICEKFVPTQIVTIDFREIQ